MGKNSDWSKESYRDRARDNEKQRGYRSYSNNRRSSDHLRNDEFFHSKIDDYEYGDRKYRQSNSEYRSSYKQQQENAYRDRERRSRSRSNDREVYSTSNNNRNYDSDLSKNNAERFEERYHQKEKKEAPNNTLMIRNLPLHVTDKDISLEINKYSLFPKDVRLMKNKDTGQSRGFAFIEFSSIEQAMQLKEMAQDYITIGEHECSLHYSFPKDGNVVDKYVLKSDWCCPKCGINNFKRRDECFKCGISKEELRQYEEQHELLQQPTNVLILRNLSPMTTEETVLIKIGTLTSLPIKSIRIISDNSYLPTNICSVELHSVYEATELLTTISSMPQGLTIDNHPVNVSYGQRMETSIIAANTSAASQNAAMAALAAAQWKNLDDSSKSTSSSSSQSNNKSNLGTVTLNGIEYTKYNAPNYNSFQYDATSGFYYDPSTGYYYDSNSQYFYNSQTQKYMYYDTTNQIYITVDSNGKATSENLSSSTSAAGAAKIGEESQKTAEEKADKTKMAKKIAKDMEKWAKTLNQKVPKQPITMQASDSSEVESLSSNASFYVFEKQLYNSDSETILAKESSSSDPFEIIKTEEERLIDRKRLACLLCKRQFNSIELLTKHQQLSELHKTNLSTLRQTLLNQEQLEHVEKVERELGYRDRAKERRDKYGIDDTPEYSKHKFDAEKEPLLNETSSAPAAPISDDNIGSRMLKAMGWTEGTGLGKSNQGMSGIIEVERRKSGFGLGNQNATFTRESYKDAVRRTALQRFKELNENK